MPKVLASRARHCNFAFNTLFLYLTAARCVSLTLGCTRQPWEGPWTPTPGVAATVRGADPLRRRCPRCWSAQATLCAMLICPTLPSPGPHSAPLLHPAHFLPPWNGSPGLYIRFITKYKGPKSSVSIFLYSVARQRTPQKITSSKNVDDFRPV